MRFRSAAPIQRDAGSCIGSALSPGPSGTVPLFWPAGSPTPIVASVDLSKRAGWRISLATQWCRTTPMTSRSDPEYCCRQAETCHEMAEKATDARDREGWLRLAQDWIELAEQGGGQVGKKSLSPSGAVQKSAKISWPVGAFRR